MTDNLIADTAYLYFVEFTNTTSPQQLTSWCRNSEPRSLADFLRASVESGAGVHACAGDYPSYLVAVVYIVDRWLRMTTQDCCTICPPRRSAAAAHQPSYVDRLAPS